jgi:hypothetical protein
MGPSIDGHSVRTTWQQAYGFPKPAEHCYG